MTEYSEIAFENIVGLKKTGLSDKTDMYVSANHSFGEDAFLLAHFTAPKRLEKVAEFGTGCGIITSLFMTANPKLDVLAVDIDDEAVCLAKRNFADAGWDISAEKKDIRNAENWEKKYENAFDMVCMNPPYFSPQSGKQNESLTRSLARHEGVGCLFSDAAKAASKVLKNGGRFCFCHRPERLAAVFEDLKRYNLEPKKLRFVQTYSHKEPRLFLCEAQKNRAVSLKVLPPFIAREADGAFSEQYHDVYKSFDMFKK